MSKRPRSSGRHTCVGVLEQLPEGTGQSGRRVPRGERAERLGHRRERHERTGHERDGEQRGKGDSRDSLRCGHEAAQQYADTDHGKGRCDHQAVAAKSLEHAASDPPAHDVPGHRHEGDRQQGIDDVGHGMPAEDGAATAWFLRSLAMLRATPNAVKTRVWAMIPPIRNSR